MGLDAAFLPVTVTPEGIIEASRHYLGLPYASGGTFVKETPAGPRGFCDCAGLFLLVAKRLGLLPADFDCNVPPSVTGMSRDDALRKILLTNFTRIEGSSLLPGDVLIIKFGLESDENTWGRHLAVLMDARPKPRGSLIHGINDNSGKGWVMEQTIDSHLHIWRCYRLNQFLAGGHPG